MKTQKRKIKEKNKSQEDKPPFFDVSCLKSRTVQVSGKYESKEVILEEWGLSNSSFDPDLGFVTNGTCVKYFCGGVKLSRNNAKNTISLEFAKFRLDFYRTRVRSLAMLVTHSLTD